MKSITLNLTVQGDNYEELKEKAEVAISKFLGTEDEEDDFFDEESIPESFRNINYELVVTQIENMSSEYQYSAQVIAKVKDVRE
jgi:hypothetical protein